MKQPTKSRRLNAQKDFSVEITQLVTDKILGSVKYPFRVFERDEPFPGCSRLAVSTSVSEGLPIHEFTRAEIKALLESSVGTVVSPRRAEDPTLEDEVFYFGGSVIELHQEVIKAAKEAGDKYEGPGVRDLQKVVDGGIVDLADTVSEIKFYSWCPRLTVIIDKKPTLKLASPRIDLSGVDLTVTATGELWIRTPWLKCERFCTKWRKIIRCFPLLRATATLRLKTAAHADIKAVGATVVGQGVVDTLRLKLPILDKIELAPFVNKALAGRLAFIFDASKLVATVPVLESKFTVESLTLPPNTGGISAEVSLREVK
jgi:hypothetical protein